MRNLTFPEKLATNLLITNFGVPQCSGTQRYDCCPLASSHARVTIGSPDVALSPDDGSCNKCKCVVELPSAFYAKNADGTDNNDLVLATKDALLPGESLSVIIAQIKSKRSIIVREELTLSDGAILKVEDPRTPSSTVNNYRDGDLNTDNLTFARNFVENITYDDERNILGHSRNYFDSKGDLLQSQSKLLSGAAPYGTVMGAQTVYDEFSRPVVNTLAAPVRSGSLQIISGTSNNIDECVSEQMNTEPAPAMVNAIDPAKLQRGEMAPFGYDNSFIKDASGEIIDFNDINPTMPMAGLTNTNSKLSWYYGNNNNGNSTGYGSMGNAAASEPYAPSSAYPFSQIIYNRDGSGEAFTSIAPGNIYRQSSSNPDLQYNTIDNVGYSLTSPMPKDNTTPSGGSYYYNNSNTNARILTIYLSLLKLYLPGIVPTSLTEDIYAQKLTRKKIVDEQNRVSYVISNERGQPVIVEKFIYNTSNTYTGTEYAFSFYDLKGQLRRSVSPNGVAAFYTSYCPTSACGGIDNSASIDHSETEFDFEGRMISSKDNDRGITYYKYRKDGLLRFSQNAEQAVNGSNDTPDRFSYTNYDRLGRPVESGEYTYSGSGDLTFASITNDILENTDVSGSLINPTVIAGKTSGGLSLANLSSRTITYYEGAESNSVDYVYPGTTPARDNSYLKGKVTASVKVGVATSWYAYDDRGRVTALLQNIIGLGTKVVTYKYNPTGQVSEVNYQEGASDDFYHAYTYDYDGRLISVKAGDTKATLLTLATYTYYKHGPLKTMYFGNKTLDRKDQHVDYIYTIEGWLKAINNPSILGNDPSSSIDPSSPVDDQFAMRMEYYNGDYLKSTDYRNLGLITGSVGTYQQHNGTPWAITYRNKALNVTNNVYANMYDYDSKNQLLSVKSGIVKINTSGLYSLGVTTTPSKNDEKFAYDANGNIQLIQRYDNAANLFQNYAPTYNSNTNQMKDAGTYVSAYTYNAIGQTKTANPNGSTYTYSYNPYGLLSNIMIGNNNQADYDYDASGQRVGIQKYGNGAAADKDFFVRDASGNILAVYNKASATSTPVLEETPMYGLSKFGSSYYASTGALSSRKYEITDHLGNVRALLNTNFIGSTTNNLVLGQDYYAYGSEIASTLGKLSINSLQYRYGYQGQFSEQDAQTGFNHFDLRDFDPVTGRWLSNDPAKQHWSGYLGMGNNPVNFTDPNGGIIKFANDYSKAQFDVAYNYLKKYNAHSILESLLEDKDYTVELEAYQNYTGDLSMNIYNADEKKIYWDPQLGAFTKNLNYLSAAILLVHEASHAYRNLGKYKMFNALDIAAESLTWFNRSERRAVIAETSAARLTGEIGLGNVTRDSYKGFIRPIQVSSPAYNRPYQMFYEQSSWYHYRASPAGHRPRFE